MTAPLLAIIAGLIALNLVQGAWILVQARQLRSTEANLRRQRIDTSLHTATMRWRT